METLIQEICRDRVLYHFRQICDIPHGSHKEKKLSDYLYRWAIDQGLTAEQDSVNNVFIRKPASPGCEEAPSIMLQAHMDMVCVKADGCDHDFEKDPIHWEINGDRLSTGGRTTLGADDGIGIALAMAVLEDPDLIHPELEVLFTVAEEEDFTGAEGFDTSKMKSSLLINLDHSEENMVVCGSCGGMKVDYELPWKGETVPEGWTCWNIGVSGLRGGHSGEDVHRGRGSANNLLTRVMVNLAKEGDFLLHSIRGGTFRLALAREADMTVWLSPECSEKLPELIESLQDSFRKEHAVTNNLLHLTAMQLNAVSQTSTHRDTVPQNAGSQLTDSKTIEPIGMNPKMPMTFLSLCPDGIVQLDEALEGVVDTSINLGEIHMSPEEGFHVVGELRSLRDSLKEAVYDRMVMISDLTGGKCSRSIEYPSWDFKAESFLFQLYSQAVENCGGPKLRRMTVHAGLEVGCFFATKKGIDAISIGPDCWDFHSPVESTSIPSVKHLYSYLCETLRSLAYIRQV